MTRGRWLAAGLAAIVLAVVACLLAGLPPLLPVVLAALAVLAVRPVPGLIYVLIVLMAPLGLWMVRADAFMAWVFGGRDYALSLSASVVAVCLLIRALTRRPPTVRQLVVALPVLAVLGVWSLIGIGHHGMAQTAAGLRITTLPLILLIVLTGLSGRQLRILLDVAAGLMTANGLAAVVEYVIGPARLISYGFQEGRAVRVIGATFRAPGLTEVNAELGLLAGSFLLGYAALWLVAGLRPGLRPVLWHVAAVAAAVALALSTSRSAALLVAGGLGAAVLLNRGGGPAARKRARVAGAAAVVLLIAGFVAVGATGAASLLERFRIWGRLIASDASWHGLGVGGAGAATYSRAATSPQVFADNYFVSLALQFGYPIAVVVVALAAWGLVRLSRGTARHEHHAVYLAVLAGLVCGALMIEIWEYGNAMACLALFVAYAMRARPDVPAEPAGERHEPVAGR